jgi:Signal transduction histidine kinase
MSFRFSLKEVTLQLQKKAERKEIQIIVETVPVTITADGDKLKQVILNILDNAIKFSDKNSQVYVVQSINKDNVAIEIMDKGMGIEEENLKDVLKSFYKINPKSVGAGLGLAIILSIVEMYGGTLQINSEYGKGTSVHIELPLECRKE